MAKNLTVRAKALGGVWETIGVERAKGVWPENFTASADNGGGNSGVGGMTTASFDLRRDGAVPWPDVSAYTDIQIEEEGRIVWDGRVSETPAREGADGRVLNVQCAGWQRHLDDDMFDRTYVHNNLSEWADARGLANQNLSGFNALGKVTTGTGALSFGWAKDDVAPDASHVGVTLDLGPNNTASSVAFDVKRIGGSGIVLIIIRGHDRDTAIDGTGFYEDPYNVASSSVANPGTIGATFTTPRRYITILALTSNAGSPVGFVTDFTFTVTGARVFSDNAYSNIGASQLHASTVITDALDRGTLLLSTDLSQITATTFNIPSLVAGGPKTPREYIDAVNAYHGYLAKVTVGRTFVYKPQPASAVVEVGAWSDMEFQDASANSGEEIYNKVIATAPGADGRPLSMSRTRQSTSDLLDVASGITIPNPSFTVNNSGWTVTTGSSITRDTTDFDSTPASGRYNPSAIGAYLYTTMTGTFVAGTTYVVQFAIKATTGAVSLIINAGQGGTLSLNPVPTTWTTYRIAWTAPAHISNANLTFYKGNDGTTPTIFIDSVSLGTMQPTLVDRRGFIRTYQLAVGSTMPNDGIALGQIADVWLDRHRSTPFRGSLTITGDRSIRDVLSGQYLPPSALLNMTGEQIRFMDRIDPDTGAYGRQGIIAGVSYDHAANRASVAIDASRKNLDALLARVGALTG